MAGRNPVVAVAFLVLVLITMPRMVASKFPRFTLSPRTKQEVQKFFRDHASDMADLFPSDGSYSDQSQPSNGLPRSRGRRQAAATQAGSYIFSFSVGSDNPQPVSGVLDINSDLVWTQCNCPDCGTSTNLQQGVEGTVFYPSRSSTMAAELCTGSTCQGFVPQTCTDTTDTRCFYTYMYHNGQANTTGYLATDTFTFDSDPVKVTFGCGFYNLGDFGGASGVIGLGKGPLSLVTQLQAGRFSYYLAPDGDSSGTESFIHFEDDSTPKTSRAMSTPLLESSAYPNFYYVGLTDIQVDGQRIGIPAGTLDLQTDGSGGVITSITIPVTFLDERAYDLLKEALKTKIGLQTADGSELGLDLCYTSRSLATATDKIPEMALVFDGNAVMKLQTWNYFYMDAATGLECLSILPSKAGGGSLLGNLIQAGTHMIYDIHGSKLQFESFQQQEQTSNQGSPAITSPLRILSLVLVLAYYMLYY